MKYQKFKILIVRINEDCCGSVILCSGAQLFSHSLSQLMITLLIAQKANKNPLILSEVNIVQHHNLMLVLELHSALKKIRQ